MLLFSSRSVLCIGVRQEGAVLRQQQWRKINPQTSYVFGNMHSEDSVALCHATPQANDIFCK